VKQYVTITVIGRDKTGVIARVTGLLFEQGANIEGLEEQVTRGQFSMVLQASWDARAWRPDRVRAELEKLGKALGMEIKLRYTEFQRRQRFAIFVTREAHVMSGLLAACRKGRLKAEPTVVLSNRPDLKDLARKHKLPFVVVPWQDRATAEEVAREVLEENQVDFVVLARFMKILSPAFVWRYKNKLINIHPSLLPSFPGSQAYRQAYERGVKVMGVTAHFVTMNLDEGPIIAQASFPVRPGMPLNEIVAAGQKLETKVMEKAVRLYLKKRLDVHWGIVREV